MARDFIIDASVVAQLGEVPPLPPQLIEQLSPRRHAEMAQGGLVDVITGILIAGSIGALVFAFRKLPLGSN